MDWVVDCSVCLALGLPDERSPRAEMFLRSTAASAIWWVPALWWCEAANALAVATRRGRVREADVFRWYELVDRLPIETDTDIDGTTSSKLYALAKEHGISAYDAAYLELAGRKGAALATLDRKLEQAAANAGIRIFHPKN